MANAKFIDATTWGNLTEIDVTDGENLFPQLPAGTYRPVLSGVASVTVPALSAGTIDQATPTEGDTLTVSGSNATGSATYQWQKGGVDISGATSASLDTTGEGAGDFRRGVSDGVQGPVYTSAVTVGAAASDFTDDFSGFTTGDDIGVDTANYDNSGSNVGQGKFEVTASDTAGMETGVNGGRIFQYIGTSPVVQNTDHFAEVEVTDIGSDSDSGHSFYVIVRAVDEDNWVGMRFYQDRMVGIYRRDSGSALSNPSASLETPATDVNPITSGDVFKIEAVGDTVTVYRNGSSVCSWTHSDLDIGGKFETGRTGLAASAAGATYNTPFRINYFKCGNA